jgi:hypothetical protein
MGGGMNMGADVADYDREYQWRLGSLHANLGTLELALRVTLYLMDTPRAERLPYTFRIAGLGIGSQLPESWLTRWAYLSNFVEEYNKRQLANGLAPVDQGIVDLRNELAHGLISSETPNDPFTLIRLSRPQNGYVTVLSQWHMTREWIDDQIQRVNRAATIVIARLNELR